MAFSFESEFGFPIGHSSAPATLVSSMYCSNADSICGDEIKMVLHAPRRRNDLGRSSGCVGPICAQGDHIGTSDTLDFLLAISAKADEDPAG